jgi:hypothetical protein
MKRCIRAALVLSLLWAIPWGILGVALGVFEYLRAGPTLALWDVPPWEVSIGSLILLFARNWAIGGAISGGLFSIVLSLLESNNSVAQIRLLRVALWGLLGSVIVPAVVIGLLSFSSRVDIRSAAVLLVTVGAFGTVSGIVTLVLARRSIVSVRSSAAA